MTLQPTTQPGERQTQAGVAAHVIIAPSIQTSRGELYVHRDYVAVPREWPEDDHIPPVDVTEEFGDVGSWVRYVQRFGATEQGSSFLAWDGEGLRAVLDYHHTDAPGRCKWIAKYPFKRSREWTAWMGLATGAEQTQKAVVEFLEDNAGDISAPSGAEVASIIRNLNVNVKAEAQTEIHTDGTTTVLFTNARRVSGGGDRFALPHSITIAIPVLKGHMDDSGRRVLYSMDVRVRANVDDAAHLSLRLSIPLAERVLEDECLEMVTQAETLVGPIYRTA